MASKSNDASSLSHTRWNGKYHSLVVEEHISNQEKEDMISDNLSKKEYMDPLRGKL